MATSGLGVGYLFLRSPGVRECPAEWGRATDRLRASQSVVELSLCTRGVVHPGFSSSLWVCASRRWSCEDDRVDAAAVKYVITSPLSLARIMWWYGEDGLGPQRPPRAGRGGRPRAAPGRAPCRSRGAQLPWPGAPLADAHLVLGAIEHLEGRPRPAARRHRRGGPMPDRLDVSESNDGATRPSLRCSGSSRSARGRRSMVHTPATSEDVRTVCPG